MCTFTHAYEEENGIQLNALCIFHKSAFTFNSLLFVFSYLFFLYISTLFNYLLYATLLLTTAPLLSDLLSSLPFNESVPML